MRAGFIVLIGPDMTARSYIRAQLIEEGFRVAAFNSIRDARNWLHVGGRVPAMVVVDVWRMRVQLESVEWLKDIADRSPVIFLTGARDRMLPELESIGDTLRRPVSIAEIVSRIRSGTRD